MSAQQYGQNGKTHDLSFEAVVLTFEYQNISNLTTIGTGCPS